MSRYRLNNVEVWFGTSDAPAPSGVATESTPKITVGMSLEAQETVVSLRYRRAGGPWQRIVLRPSITTNEARYFNGRFPELPAGTLIEYEIYVRCGGASPKPECKVGDTNSFEIEKGLGTGNPPSGTLSSRVADLSKSKVIPKTGPTAGITGMTTPKPSDSSPTRVPPKSTTPGKPGIEGRTPLSSPKSEQPKKVVLRPDIFRLTPKDREKLNEQEKELINRKLDSRFKERLIGRVVSASEPLKAAINKLTIDHREFSGKTVDDVLKLHVFPELKKDEGLAREVEALENKPPAGASEKVDDALYLNTPLIKNPLLSDELRVSRTSEYARISKLGAGATDKLIQKSMILEDASEWELDNLVNEGILTNNQKDDLIFTVDLGRLTNDNFKFMERLKTNERKSVRDFVSLSKSDWLKIIEDEKIDPPSGETREDYADNIAYNIDKTYPSQVLLHRLTRIDVRKTTDSLDEVAPLFAGNDLIIHKGKVSVTNWDKITPAQRGKVGETLNNLANLANTYRYLGIAGMINDKNINLAQKKGVITTRIKHLDTFNKNNPDFDLRTVNFFDKKNGKLIWKDIPASDQPLVRKQLMAYQRMLTLADTLEDRQALLNSGNDSAITIARKTEGDFAKNSGLESGMSRKIFANAHTKALVIAHELQIFREVAKEIRTNVSNTSPLLINDLREIDGFDDMFDSQDYCDCAHCKSILGPAAYFVDMMYFIEQHVSTPIFTDPTIVPGRSNHPLYLKMRRPDLWKLKLTCENTNTLVPYLTIVNEVLEAYLDQNNIIQGGDIFQTLSKQTQPEEKISFHLPFNLPLEEIRIYLKHFGIALHDIYRILKHSEDKIWRERLSLSAEELAVITTADTPGAAFRFGMPPPLDPLTLNNFLVTTPLDDFPVNDYKDNTVGGVDRRGFIKYAGITRPQLDDLRALRFYDLRNITVDKMPLPDELQNFPEILKGLTPIRLDFIHRFIRLWKKTPWSIPDLDLVLTALQKFPLNISNLNDNAVMYLAQLVDIQEKLKLTVEELCAMFHQLPASKDFPAPPAKEKDKKLFERLFDVKKLFEDPVTHTIKLSTTFHHYSLNKNDPNDKSIDPKTPILLGGLGISETELLMLADLLELSMPFNVNGDTTLNRENISLLYRQARLSRALKLSVEDFIQVLYLFVSSDFYVDEFVSPLTIAGLCTAINNDQYNIIPLNAPINTLAWLNELLMVPDFYTALHARKPGKGFSTTITDLVNETNNYRTKSYSNLNNNEQNTIKRLNRLLLEETYPQETPKSYLIFPLPSTVTTFPQIQQLVRFRDWLKSSPFTVSELRFILKGEESNTVKYKTTLDTIVTIVQETQKYQVVDKTTREAIGKIVQEAQKSQDAVDALKDSLSRLFNLTADQMISVLKVVSININSAEIKSALDSQFTNGVPLNPADFDALSNLVNEIERIVTIGVIVQEVQNNQTTNKTTLEIIGKIVQEVQKSQKTDKVEAMKDSLTKFFGLTDDHLNEVVGKVSININGIGIQTSLNAPFTNGTPDNPADLNALFSMVSEIEMIETITGIVREVQKSSSNFSAGEFKTPLSIEKLCKAIVDDNYGASIQSIQSRINTIDWLNELLKLPNFYDILHVKKPSINFSHGTTNLVNITNNYRNGIFSNLNIDEQNTIKKLNRLILEETYPQETPKISELKALKESLSRFFSLTADQLNEALNVVPTNITSAGIQTALNAQFTINGVPANPGDLDTLSNLVQEIGWIERTELLKTSLAKFFNVTSNHLAEDLKLASIDIASPVIRTALNAQFTNGIPVNPVDLKTLFALVKEMELIERIGILKNSLAKHFNMTADQLIDTLKWAGTDINAPGIQTALYADVTLSPDFYEDEFKPPLTLTRLCTAINNDQYGVSLNATINTPAWLNELLRGQNFYDMLHTKKHGISFSNTLMDLIHETNDYKTKSYSDLNNNEQNTIKRLNRLLLEETYPQETPKSSFSNGVFVNPTVLSPLLTVMQKMERVLLVFSNLKFKEETIAYLTYHPAALGIWDLKNLTLNDLKALTFYKKLITLGEEAEPMVQTVLDHYLAAMGSNIPSYDAFSLNDVTTLAGLWQQDKDLIASLTKSLTLDTVPIRALEHLWECLNLCQTLGINGYSLQRLADDANFYADEFKPPMTIARLCTVINNDQYNNISLKAPINTLAWLNELLMVPDFYTALHAKKPGKSFSNTVMDLINKTNNYRNKSYSSLNNDEQNTIKQLNRLLLEETYLQETPKSFFTHPTAARDVVVGAFSSKYDDEKVRQEKLEPYLDKINVKKRDALCDYIIAREKDLKFKDMGDIYAFFLLDVEMSGCFRTSRVVCAISSLQLYVHRILMNLEQSATPLPSTSPPKYLSVMIEMNQLTVTQGGKSINHLETFKQEWEEWRKNYRVWEANRKVFLYPENYIEPDLRDNKSPIFKELEDELLQQKITKESAEAAYKKYLAQFAELARLRIAGSYYYADTNTYYFFGRTQQDPPQYYYRKWVDNKVWAPWEKIELGINADRVCASIHLGKLYLFWIDFKSEKMNKIENGDALLAAYKYTFNLSYSYLNENSKWLPAQRKEFSIIAEAPYDKNGQPMDIDLSPFFGKVCFPLIRSGNIELYYYIKYFVNNWIYFIKLNLFKNEIITAGYTGNSRSNIPNGTNVILPKIDQSNMAYLASSPAITSIEGLVYDYMLYAMSKEFDPKFIPNLTSYLSNEIAITETFNRDLRPELFIVAEKPGDFLLILNNQQFLIKVSDANSFPRRITYRISTSLADKLGEILFSQGLELFLSLNTQKFTEFQIGINSKDPSELSLPIDNPDHIDFNGAYGEYYQELFFHIPFLIANHLNANQKFKEAKWWYERIFDPTSSEAPDPQKPTDRNWQYIMFRNLDIKKMKDILTDPAAIEMYKKDPFNPHAIASLRISAYQKTIVMKYIDNLLDWGDYLFAQDTMESINEATMLYVLAADILGKRPVKLGPCKTDEDAYLTYETIGPKISEEPVPGKKNEFLITLENLNLLFYEVPRVSFEPPVFTLVAPADTNTALASTTGGTTADSNIKTSAEISSPVINMSTKEVKPRNKVAHYTRVAEEKGQSTKSVGSLGYTNTATYAGITLESAGPVMKYPGVQWEYTGPVRTYPGIQFVQESTMVFCVPPNEDFLKYWDRVEDRLFKIRNCMNISGVRRQLALFQPPINPMLLVRAKAAGLSLEDILGMLAAQLPPYRFSYLIEKAKQFTQTVQSFGSTLLSALEKKDVEELTLLRSVHERNILRMTKEIKKQQIKEARYQYQAMVETETNVHNRITYYEGLIETGLTGWEVTQQVSTHAATTFEIAASTQKLLGSILYLLPQLGSPFAMKYGGVELGNSAQAIGLMLSSLASISHSIAASAGLEATYQRREEEWEQQLLLAQQEFKQVGQQKLAAEIRLDIANKDREIHEKNIEQADDLHAFYLGNDNDNVKGKFTNLGLYNYLSITLNRLYREAYNVAYDMANMAERTYQFERDDDTIFIAGDNWQFDRAGLLAGERLLLQLQRMEKAYLERHTRDYEVTQSFSLALLDPSALVMLRQTGSCEFTIPEFVFDLFYPGQYKRIIKSVRITIPCVTGPYINISAKLTLKGSKVRKEIPAAPAALQDPTTLLDVPNQKLTSIATSNAQNDGGVFELNFRDERYLPFEGAGAISKWGLEMPNKFRSFSYDTISDVIIHISYTAKDDGVFRATVEDQIADTLTTYATTKGLYRLLSLKHEFPNALYKLLNPSGASQTTEFSVEKSHFPYLFIDKTLTITEAKIYLKPKKGLSISTPTPMNAVTWETSEDIEVPGRTDPEIDKIKGGKVSISGNIPITWTINAGVNGLNKDELDDILILLKYTIS